MRIWCEFKSERNTIKFLPQLLTIMSIYEALASVFTRDPIETTQNDQKIPIDYDAKPWKNNPQYFKKVYISPLATIKMAVHANAGGSIEVMGMMTGSIVRNGIIVNDVYPLPVEGTETRVNAQAEGYEYMVQYLECLKQVGRKEHIVGWYHSHPGYGCWLSGIDVATQSLNQNFQDPYLAVVVDPFKTVKQGKVEIGAFRTFPENWVFIRIGIIHLKWKFQGPKLIQKSSTISSTNHGSRFSHRQTAKLP